MPAYLLVQADVRDWDAYREYMRRTPRIIEKYGGHFIVRGGEKVTLEGPHEETRVAIIEFPTLAHVSAFYASPEYESVKKFRADAGSARFIAIDGYSVEQWREAVAQSEQVAADDAARR